MRRHYLLAASGQDHPGFVAAITKVLFKLNCNLEDSSMMRLGSEFAMFVIFSAEKKLSNANFSSLQHGSDLTVTVRPLSGRQARFTPSRRESYIVRVHGQDHPGIVFQVTSCLAKHRFNITDLSTHRTILGRTPGYILLLEGELLRSRSLSKLKLDLKSLAARIKTKITLEPVSTAAL